MTTPREKEIYKVTIVGAVANFALIVFKFAAGILGHSAAMIADAVHSLSDFFTDVVVVAFVRISNKPKDRDHNYGHGKFETLATLIIGLALIVVGVGIAANGILQIVKVAQGETLESPGAIAFAAALISIAIKEVLYRYTEKKGREVRSDAVIANAWHHRSDAFSSIATAVGIGGAVILGSKWAVLDPIAALLVSVFIVKMAISLMKSALDELLEKSLPEETKREIYDIIKSVDGVKMPHNVHTRKIGNYIAIEMHIMMPGTTQLAVAHRIASDTENRLKDRFGPETHVTVHMEPLN